VTVKHCFYYNVSHSWTQCLSKIRMVGDTALETRARSSSQLKSATDIYVK
jgi:hypothetical protein